MTPIKLNSDWQGTVLSFWTQIPKAWKQAFFGAFALNVFVFFFDLAQFPLGDHDVGYIDGISLLNGGRAGRWFNPAINLLSGYVQIPVYTQCFAFVSQIMAGMAAVLLWKRDATAWQLFVGATIVSCLPVVTDFYYYHFQALAFTSSQLLMLIGLHFAILGEARNRLAFLCISVILFTCGIASYQSSVMTWSVCFWGLFCVRLAGMDNFRQCLKCLLPAFACMLIACILYSISLRLYPLVGLSLDLYQFKTLKFTDLPARFFDLFQHSYSHLVSPQGYFSLWMKMLLLAGMLAGIISWSMLANSRRLILLPCLAIMPVAAKSQFLVSATTGWETFRFAGLALSYCYVFFFLGLMTSNKQALRNLAFALVILLLPCFAINCLDEQVTHVRQTEHDLALLNRIVGRLESMPDFAPEKTYNLVQLGKPTCFVKDNREPLSGRSVGQNWNPGFELWLLARYLRLGDRLNEEMFKRPDLLRLAVEHMRDKKPFPHRDGIAIVNDTIIFYFDSAAIKVAEANLAKGKVR